MPILPPIEDLEGAIDYEVASAFLTEDSGLRSLLVMDRPPNGFNAADIGIAFSFLKHVIRKSEGDRLFVRGFRGELSGHPIVLIIRVLD